MQIEAVAFPGTPKDHLCGKSPFEDVPNTNYGHYALQQSIYSELLSRHYGVEISKMILLQVHPNQQSYRVHEVRDLRDKVRTIFADREKELRREKTPLKRSVADYFSPSGGAVKRACTEKTVE